MTRSETVNADPTCPACGEPVRPGWKICPACEGPLSPPACPRCGAEVRPHWRRCPECEAPLVCADCGRRLAAGEAACPQCRPAGPAAADTTWTEPVTGMVFVRVPGGTFPMGDGFGDGVENETPVHEVRLDAFHIARTPVTQAEWRRLMPANPSRFEGADRPVEQVSWADVAAFLAALDRASGGAGRRFDLPTEAQWEYAARSGGRAERWAGGDPVDALAWTEANSGGASRPVGRLRPNGLGLYDMSGNVWEWCRDAFRADAYRRHAAADPLVSPVGGDRVDRVIRGGSWNLDAWSARCARRFAYPEDFLGPALGFRVVMTVGDG